MYRIQGKTCQSHLHVAFNHDGLTCRLVLFFGENKFLAVVGVRTFNSKQQVEALCGSGIHGNRQP